MTDIQIDAADGGTFNAYFARPASGTGPGIVVIQEIFGVNDVMRKTCDDLAKDGYFALCPDLFWRQTPGVQLTDKTEEEWAKAFELMKGFSATRGIEDLIASLDHLRGFEGCTGKVGTIGYCLGGKLAFLMATRSDADCNVSYYGVGIENSLDEANAITKPLLMHVAKKDKFSSPEAQAQIRDVLGKNICVTIHTYPGCDHAFARVGGEHYDREAAELANRRSAAFLAENLKE
jgi:carboxymethylenebutenolidase